MKNKNTFQKDQNGIKDPDIGIFQFLTHTLTHSSFIHVTFERQQMSVLQGNKVFVANSTLTFQTTITLAPPSPGMGKKIYKINPCEKIHVLTEYKVIYIHFIFMSK